MQEEMDFQAQRRAAEIVDQITGGISRKRTSLEIVWLLMHDGKWCSAEFLIDQAGREALRRVRQLRGEPFGLVIEAQQGNPWYPKGKGGAGWWYRINMEKTPHANLWATIRHFEAVARKAAR